LQERISYFHVVSVALQTVPLPPASACGSNQDELAGRIHPDFIASVRKKLDLDQREAGQGA
jgi:hypothetical protein